MALIGNVAHRAARQLRRAIPVVAALAVALTAAVTVARPAQAAYAPRVVIVVGPVGSATSDFLSHARAYARQARAYGATVTEVYTPHATWSRVLQVAQGANVLIYLGHGNGWPSPYKPYQGLTKNGLGLNPYDGSGNTKVKYYGESYVAKHIRLAPGAIVLLNRLCYASGNGEHGMAEPSWPTAIKRVDNYAAGFLRTGAGAVLADGHTNLAYELVALFGPSRTMSELWTSDPDTHGHIRGVDSARTPGTRNHLDPDRANAGFYRSLAIRSGASTGAIRIAAFAGSPRSASYLRSGPSTDAQRITVVTANARLVVRGSLTSDPAGRTWVPVMTRAGKPGWVAAWIVAFGGTATTRTPLVLRKTPSLHGARQQVVRENARVTVIASSRDAALRTWLKVRTPLGRTGWIAAWLTRP